MPEDQPGSVVEGVRADQPDGRGHQVAPSVGRVSGERHLDDAVALGAEGDQPGELAAVVERPGGATPRGVVLVDAKEERAGVLLRVGRWHGGPPDPMVLVGTLTILAVAQTGSLFSADAWNNVTFTAGEVKNPQRNLPLSLAMGTGVVILLYLLCNVIFLNVLPLDGSATARRSSSEESSTPPKTA